MYPTPAGPPPAQMAPPISPQPPQGHPESVSQLLARGYTLPCSTAAQAFTHMVPPLNRFPVALEVLLPILESSQSESSHRILVSYILYSMYAPHPIGINPFKSALYDTFIKERKLAIENQDAINSAEREQFVWVLWKILRGDGQDLGPFSPSQFVRSALPSKLRPSSLVLDEDQFKDDFADSTRGELQTEGPQPPVSAEEDAHAQIISQGATLLLAARERVLTLSEMRILAGVLPDLTTPSILTSYDLSRVVAFNPNLAHPLLVSALSKGEEIAENCIEVLSNLPPTMPSLDVIGRLLRDNTAVHDAANGNTTIADIVRLDVLGRFVSNAVQWLEEAEADERAGLVSDDRFAQGVQNLCRFYNSLIKLGIVDPTSDIDSAEMITFTLSHSRFEEANALYRVLAAGRY
ncbi:unnamed protein product [Peniophora sp. CBMAI 1063]|nr:unnamed protein product [Peniophora sp. CBMAI 1063]